jgi:hypothetical protein
LRTRYRAVLAVLTIAFVTSLTGILINLASNKVKVDGPSGDVALWTGLVILSIAGAAITYRMGKKDLPDPVGRAAAGLRQALQDRWEGDPVWSSVREGGRLPVRWAPADVDRFPANNRK